MFHSNLEISLLAASAESAVCFSALWQSYINALRLLSVIINIKIHMID